MSGWLSLALAWHWEPRVVGGTGLLLGLYLGLMVPLTRRAGLFGAGLLVLLLSLVSPLHALADTYLFSAHMLQHMLLVLVVPPLLLLGLPAAAPATLRGLGRGWPAWLARRPLIAWSGGMGVLWLWHLPPLYEAALQQPVVHHLQHLSLLATAVLFWWPVLGGGGFRPSLPPWAALLYLGLAAMTGSLLGILLAFAPAGLYPSYLAPDDRLGLLPLLRGELGLTPAADQQLGGLLMWIPGGLLYSAAMLPIVARWLAEPEPAASQEVR